MSTAAILEQVEKIRAHGDTEKRVVRRMEIGSVIQQGDVYLHRVHDDHARGKEIKAIDGAVQIALGTGNGARHMVLGASAVHEGLALPPGVSIPDVDPRQLLGPVVVARTPFDVTHPEHAHFTLPAGVYQVTYQFDPRTMRRVAD